MRLARMGRVPGASAGVRGVVERLVNVLAHNDKGGRLAFAIDVPAALHLAMQEEHLSEVVGAVLENAVNYARRTVRITAAAGPEWNTVSDEADSRGPAPQRQAKARVPGHRHDSPAGPGQG